MSRDVPKLPREKGCKWRHNPRKCRNKVACPHPMSTGDKRTKSVWSSLSIGLSLNGTKAYKGGKKNLFIRIFCHNFSKWCVFSKTELCSLHMWLLAPCHSFPCSCLRSFKSETICNEIFYCPALCGTKWSLQALGVNVSVFPKYWTTKTADLSNGYHRQS